LVVCGNGTRARIQCDNWVSERGFFRRTFLQVFGVTLLIDFLMNDLVVLSLPIELFLVAAVTFLGLVAIVARRDRSTQQVASMMGCLTTVIGLGLATYVIFNVVTNWNKVTTKEHLLELLLPAWLTLGFLPFLYLIGVMVAYQCAFTESIGLCGIASNLFGRFNLRWSASFVANRVTRPTSSVVGSMMRLPLVRCEG
jgi:D-alanyl-lipoteichoic acid acyltransferase DltB (MBOAT superfamily)